MRLTFLPIFGNHGGRNGVATGASWNVRMGGVEKLWKRIVSYVEIGRSGRIRFRALQKRTGTDGCGSMELGDIGHAKGSKRSFHVEVQFEVRDGIG